MAKVLLEYEGNIDGLKATLKQIEDANVQISDSAAESAKKVTTEYQKVGQVAKNAFAGQEVNKALQQQVDSVSQLTTELEQLYKEELKLLQANKQGSVEFAKNAKAIDAARQQFDQLKGVVTKINTELPKTAKEISELEDELKALAIAGKQNTKEFDDIARAIGEYKAAITTADRAVDLYAKSTDAATGRLGELEDKLYDLALAGQTNTQEFKDTIAEVTKLKRAVFEVDQQVDSYVERSRGFTTVVQNVELLGNAFQVVEGATAAFGVESEELQETLVRLNALIAVTNGLQQVRTILLEQDAKKTGIAAVAQRAYTLAVGTSTGALKAFRVAIAATGVGALLVGVGFLIEKIISFRSENDKLTDSLNRSNEALESARKGVKSFEERIQEASENIAVANGTITKSQADLNKELRNVRKESIELYKPLISESNQLKLELDELNKQIERQNQAIGTGASASFADAAAKERKAKIEARLGEIQTEINNISQKSIDLQILLTKQSKLNSEQTDKSTKSSKENANAVNEQAKAYEQLSINASDVLSRLIEADQAIRNATTNALISSREAELSRLRVLLDQGLATRRQVADAEIKLVLANQRAQIEAVEDGLKESTKNVKAGTLEDISLRNAAKQEIINIEQQSAEQIFNINKALNEALSEANKKQIEERKQRNEELIREVFQYVNAIGEAFNAIADLQRQITENRIAEIEKVRDAELKANDNAEQSFAKRKRNEEAINLRASRKIIEEKRKQARLDKALAIFTASVDTAQAIVASVKESPQTFGLPFSAFAAITGAAQIAKISSEPLPQFGKGGWVDGEPHSRGGVDINAEGGEFVTNKRSARTHKAELEAINKGRSAFMKLIEQQYIRPRVIEAVTRKDSAMNVNVDARLNSAGMERELVALRRETKRTGRVITKALATSHSSRYNW